MIYKIEQRIFTLIDNAVINEGTFTASFETGSTKFSHWDFSYSRGWPSDLWLVEDLIEAGSLLEAVRSFGKTLVRVVPRISFIGQSYIEFLTEPYLVLKSGSNAAYFRYTKSRGATGLMFANKDLAALRRLLEEKTVPEEFFYYWNDAVNATGYTPKLLLMFSAIEALAKTAKGKKDWDMIREILGEDLTTALFGVIGNSSTGLRHRLTHGEYLSAEDSGKNYLELIHKRVIGYFNQQILKEDLISTDVVAPQRHPWGNKEGGQWFIRSKSGAPLALKDVVADFDKNDISHLEHYEYAWDMRPESY